jgi:hypothetical protein
MFGGYGAVGKGAALPEGERNAADGVRAAHGERPAAGGRPAQRARATGADGGANRRVHRRAPAGSAAELIERALLADAARWGVTFAVERARATAWASATFSGARHHLTVRGESAARAQGWLAALPEAELPVRGNLVADLAVLAQARDGDAWSAELELLTVEER